MSSAQDRAASGPTWRPWGGLLDPLILRGKTRPEASFLLSLLMESEDFLSWRASRRPETFLSNGPCVFHTFDLQLKLAKCGLKASGGPKIGLVS